jgi:osmotically-inducible protein OsmY
MKTFFVPALSSLLVLGVTGCAHRQSESAGEYSNATSTAPTSNNSAQRVYNTTITGPGGAQASVTQGASSPGPNEEITETVRRMILSDPKLAPYPSKVTAMMDPKAKGKVILTGFVPTAGVKRNLVKRVSEVPGVTKVEDKLVLDVPSKSREVDFTDPTK